MHVMERNGEFRSPSIKLIFLSNFVPGLVSPMEFVKLTSAKAAQVFNIYPQKGVIAVGSDADIIVLDPNQKHVISARNHHSRMDTNIYEGKEVRGKVRALYLGFLREIARWW